MLYDVSPVVLPTATPRETLHHLSKSNEKDGHGSKLHAQAAADDGEESSIDCGKMQKMKHQRWESMDRKE